ncbi:MAG TPA: glucose-6-phosphate dehydrogenase assembly protein OpcA [Bryobacteraceae bacterium]|nr:glucose-6-phosphate dehydrogenase assembly protein OpcA [Bryobacteraceae bacterium]
MAAVLSPERILRELADLWASSSQGEHPETGDGVLRACSMTLVVLAEASEDASTLGETLAALMPEHPARVILIRLTGPGERDLSDRVYQQCWKPFGQRRQICCEQIEITASDAALGDLPPVVLPLAVSDVPVILWCRATRLLGMPEFDEIAAMATKTVLDSGAMADARGALDSVAELAHTCVIGDLAWTRLTRWREMLAQVFGNRQRLEQIGGISHVHVAFGPSYETGAWYLAAWVNDAVNSAGARPQVTAAPEGNLPSIRLELEGEGLRVRLVRHGETLIATVNELSQCTNLTPPSDYLLMHEELRIVSRDGVFERALAGALRMAPPAV